MFRIFELCICLKNEMDFPTRDRKIKTTHFPEPVESADSIVHFLGTLPPPFRIAILPRPGTTSFAFSEVRMPADLRPLMNMLETSVVLAGVASNASACSTTDLPMAANCRVLNFFGGGDCAANAESGNASTENGCCLNAD